MGGSSAAGIKEGRLAFMSDARRGPVRWLPIGNCALPAWGIQEPGQRARRDGFVSYRDGGRARRSRQHECGRPQEKDETKAGSSHLLLHWS